LLTKGHLLLANQFSECFRFFFHCCLQVLSLLGRQVAPLLDAFDLLLNFPILVLKLVGLRPQCVNVVDQGIDLLFSLDEGSHNFIIGLDASSFFNLIKRILNDLNIAQVLFHQPFLLLVGRHYFGQTQFQDLNRVLVVLRVVSRSLLGLGLFLIHGERFLSFQEPLLHFFNLDLEMLLVLFVLGSQCNPLRQVLIRHLLVHNGLLILLLGQCLGLICQFAQSFVLVPL